jgi:hypothetical protein
MCHPEDFKEAVNHPDRRDVNRACYCMLLVLGNGLDGQLLLRRSLVASWASRAMVSMAPSRLLLPMSAWRI